MTDETVKWHRDDYTRSFIVTPSGAKSALPRYYADKIYNYTDLSTSMSAKEMQAEYFDSDLKRSQRESYDDYVRKYGDGNGYVRAQWDNRIVAIKNFQKKASGRS